MPIPTLDPPPRLLCGPGPSDVEPAVLDAMRRPMLGHLDPAFHAVLDEVVELLRRLWRCPTATCSPLPSTGTSAMEAGIVNLLDPGDTAIVAEAGFFGKRLGDMVERRGATAVRVTAPWGETVPNAALLDALDRHPEARLIAVVHAETSTGALHPLRDLATALFGCDVLLMADCVTSLGGIPLETGAWGIDYAYSCTQKCLAAPPGMAPVAISPRAWRRIGSGRAGRRYRSRSTSSCLRRYWVDRPAVYHHTTPILGGLRAARGAPSSCSRKGSRRAGRGTRRRGAHLQAALRGRGLELFADPVRQMAPLTGCGCPRDRRQGGTGAAAGASRGSRSAAGSGRRRPPMWRIGLMGRDATTAAATRVLAAR